MRKRWLPGFLITALWVLPLMAALLVGGYALGGRVLGPRYLQPTEIHNNRPQPVRILTPEQAAAVAHDEPSRVWSEGVKDSDIPKINPDAPPQHRWHRKPSPSLKEQPASDANTDVQPTPAPDATDTPAPDTTPATPTPDTPAPPADTPKPDGSEPVSPD